MRPSRLSRSVLLVGLLGGGFAACSGSIGDPGNPAPGVGPGPTGPGPVVPGQPMPMPMPPEGGPTPPPETTGPAADVPGPAYVRRLTRLEYNNTIRDLLGDDSRPGDKFPGDQESHDSGFVKGGSVSDADATQLMQIARDLATRAQPKLPMLLPCGGTPAPAAEESCAHDFIAKFGRRAFRRPLSEAEVAGLVALYKDQRAAAVGHDFPNAIRVVMQAMLLSPNFLYRWELGDAKPMRDGAFVRFNQHEMASRLSYFLWASMPDDKLFAAADAGRLGSPQQIDDEVRRLLKDPKATDAITDFHLQLLGIGGTVETLKDSGVYPKWNKALAQSMLNETRAFVGQVFGPTGDGKLETLLTGTETFVDPALAEIYGVKATGTGVSKVKLDPAQRAGILTQANFLTVLANTYESHPVERGVMVLEQVLCRHLPAAPPNVGEPSAAKEGVSTRSRYAEHGKKECAKSCHSIIDPFGFAFENYDGLGVFRTKDYGTDVDASGEVELRSGKKAFKNALELLPALATDSETQDCFAKQWLRYGLRRDYQDGDAATLGAARAAFKQSGGDLREAIVAIAKSRAFTHRTPSAGEMLP